MKLNLGRKGATERNPLSPVKSTYERSEDKEWCNTILTKLKDVGGLC